jgi:hypothetical protein
LEKAAHVSLRVSSVAFSTLWLHWADGHCMALVGCFWFTFFFVLAHNFWEHTVHSINFFVFVGPTEIRWCKMRALAFKISPAWWTMKLQAQMILTTHSPDQRSKSPECSTCRSKATLPHKRVLIHSLQWHSLSSHSIACHSTQFLPTQTTVAFPLDQMWKWTILCLSLSFSFGCDFNIVYSGSASVIFWVLC